MAFERRLYPASFPFFHNVLQKVKISELCFAYGALYINLPDILNVEKKNNPNKRNEDRTIFV